jgi:hypothetical protein
MEKSEFKIINPPLFPDEGKFPTAIKRKIEWESVKHDILEDPILERLLHDAEQVLNKAIPTGIIENGEMRIIMDEISQRRFEFILKHIEIRRDDIIAIYS